MHLQVGAWCKRLNGLLAAACLFLIITPCLATEQLIVQPDAGPQPILHAIAQAQSSVDLAMYGFTDERLVNAFIKAKNEKKNVRILLQHFPYRSVDENLAIIHSLAANHVPYAYAPLKFYLLHQKTLIIDHQSAIVMTFNFTHSTFKKERNFGLIINDPDMVQEIQQVFNADWLNQSIHPQHPSLVWSPDNSREKILQLIKSATTEIKMYAQGLSDYQVIGALAQAAQKGIVVQIVTSGPTGKKWNYLKRAGVSFHLDHKQMIHAKVLIIDQKKAMLGSINFTKPSLDRNRELSVIVDDPAIVHELIKVFLSDWRGSLPLEYAALYHATKHIWPKIKRRLSSLHHG